MRCMPLATEGGDSIWMTRSMAPMSMPSSSEEVATTARICPVLRRVFDFGALGGGERAVVGAGERLLGEIVDEAGEALGGAAVVDEDEGGLAGEDDGEETGRDGGPDGGTFRGRNRREVGGGDVVEKSSTGNFNFELEALGFGGVDDGDGAGIGYHSVGRWGGGRAAALLSFGMIHATEKEGDFFERALGGGEADALEGRAAMASRRSSESARCAPRLVGTRAWISSTMTVSTVRRAEAASEVSSR